jgi:signal transduction histidine kinase
MHLADMPIRRKLTVAILATSIVVMALMSGAFVTYEVVSIRRTIVRQVTTLGKIVATNSTAALAFENQDDATEILSALSAEKNIAAACLYDRNGHLFAKYPASLGAEAFPAAPGPAGPDFSYARLLVFQPVVQGENKQLGTLYIDFDTGAIIADWLRLSVGVGLAVLAVVLTVAYLLSRSLQRQISQPIVALAETARAISDRRDYSVRAARHGADELGLLTSAFNQMLDQIQELNQGLERLVATRTAELETANVDLRRSRAELNNLFESLPGLYLVLTPELSIVTASDAYLKATMTTRESIIGRNMFDVFPDNPDEVGATGVSNVRTSLERVRQSGAPETMAIQKYDVRGPDGVFEVHYWSPINSPVLGLDGSVKYIIHRVEEVTDFVLTRAKTGGSQTELQARMERMESEVFKSTQQVQTTNRQLEAANKELEAFSYSVSHDLRAPLRHVDGFAALLTKHAAKTLDEKGLHLLNTISKSAKQMGRLIDDLLEFSRTGRTALRITEVDQDSLVAAVIKEATMDKGAAAIEWKVAPLPHVNADPGLLRQVWANLIQNAIKYSGTTPHPVIEIASQPGTQGAETVFSIKDNGVGFDMSYVDKLFGVFQRLHAATEFEGTGIGLANVRRIVVRHGGRAWAEGAVGQGATFYFSIPLGGPDLAAQNRT